MQKLIIDIIAGEARYIDLTDEDEQQRLKDTIESEKEEEERIRIENKQAEALERLRANPKMADVVEALGLAVEVAKSE